MPATATAFPVLAMAVALAACRAAPVPEAPPQDPETAFLLTPKEAWFGVYLDGHKAGWSSTTTTVEERNGQPVVVRRSAFQLTTSSDGVASRVRTENEEVYQGRPPFLLLGSSARQERNDSVTTLRTRRDGDDLVLNTGDGDAAPRRLRQADYGLRDAFAVTLWLRGGARPGDRRTVRTLDLDNLRIGRDRVRLVDTHTGVVSGVLRSWHELQRTGPTEGTHERELVAPDGTTLSWSLGAMELRAEPREQAQAISGVLDLGLLGSAAIDRELGDPRGVTRLVVRARGRGVAGLVDGPGQQVTQLADDTVRVTVAPGGDPPAAARRNEVLTAAGETLRFPTGDPRVQSLARQAVGDAQDPRQRVARLLAFVAEYVADSYTECDHASVFQVMERRTGDCSDHTLLFTTLARAVGIPCRPVLGLAYQGDATRAFGPHEWCEVVLDGAWIPVDPTFAQLPADAARLRLGPEAGLSAAVADFVLELEAVDRR